MVTCVDILVCQFWGFCVGYVLWGCPETNTKKHTYRRSTLISFSSESSLPFSAFLSMILTANIWPGCSRLSANRTSENAPLRIGNRVNRRVRGLLSTKVYTNVYQDEIVCLPIQHELNYVAATFWQHSVILITTIAYTILIVYIYLFLKLNITSFYDQMAIL